MKFSEYVPLAMRTARHSTGTPQEVNLELTIRALGLSGELVELDNATSAQGPRMLEVGDVAWYAATLSHAVGGLDEEPDSCLAAGNMYSMLSCAGKIAECIKKHAGHGKELNKREIKLQLICLLDCLASFCSANGFTLSDALDANIEKLKKRYPEGFSVEASLNRVE